MNYGYIKFKIKDYIRKILKSTPVIKCMSFLIFIYANFAGKTTKWSYDGIDEFVKECKNNNAILIGWHSRATMMPFFWKRLLNNRLSALVSPHQDGQIIAHFLKWFGIKPICGSTNEKARQGALGLMRELIDGSSLFIAPDGPRGPRMRLKRSPVYYAKKTGKPIYCVCFSSSKGLVFEKAWDNTLIILPFGIGRFCISKPIYVPENINEEEFEQYRKKIEDIAIKQSVECDEFVGRTPCYPADVNDYKKKENEI